MILRSLDRFRDHGLLVLRIGMGAMFVFHGLPKLLGGPETWAKVGSATSFVGLDVAPTFFGLLAACTETFGGILLALGLLTRPAVVALLGVMIVAAAYHLGKGDGLKGASHAIEAGIVFLSLIFIGPGRFSLDEKLGARRAGSSAAVG